MQNGMFFKYFNGKVISALVVDVFDRIYIQISNLVKSEDYAPGELVYVGNWADRPVEEIYNLVNELQLLEYRNWIRTFLDKRMNGKKPPIMKWNEMKLKKQKQLFLNADKIEDFCYADLWFLKKRLQTPIDSLKECTSLIRNDLEKYPAGYAVYLLNKFNVTIRPTINEIINGATKKYSEEEKNEIWKNLIKESPKNIRKIKWLLKNAVYDGNLSNIRTSSKWEFYCSRTCLPTISWNQMKWYLHRTFVQSNRTKYASFAYSAAQIKDYMDWYTRVHNNGVEIKLSTRVVQDAYYWHHAGCPNRENVGDALMPRNPKSPDSLEQYRIKTAKEMQDLGSECHHCLGSKWLSNSQFYTVATDDRSSVVCAEVMITTKARIIQIFDKYNKTTEESKAFKLLLKNELGIKDDDADFSSMFERMEEQEQIVRIEPQAIAPVQAQLIDDMPF